MRKARSKEVVFASPMMPDVLNPSAKHTLYREDIVDEICERLAMGESLSKICGDNGHPKATPNMPDMRTVTRWLARYPDFRERYKMAREIQAETMMDELVGIADESQDDHMQIVNKRGETITVLNREAVERSRLRVQARQWAITKLHPKKYGEKVDVNHSGAVGAFDLSKMTTDDLEHLERILTGAAPEEGDQQ